MRKLLAFAVAALGSFSLPAQEQPAQPLTVVSVFDVKPGKEAAFLNLARKYYAPTLDKLMSGGSVLGWGIDRTVFHLRDSPGYDAWFSAPDYAAVEKTMGAIEEVRSKMSEIDRREWAASVDNARHYDLVMRDVLSKFKGPSDGSLPYIMINTMRVKPGMMSQWMEFGQKHILPVYDTLMEQGAIHGYSVMMEDEHGSAPENRYVLLSLPNLAARDKVVAAMHRMAQTQPDAMKELMSTMEDGSHRDETLKALIFKVKQP